MNKIGSQSDLSVSLATEKEKQPNKTLVFAIVIILGAISGALVAVGLVGYFQKISIDPMLSIAFTATGLIGGVVVVVIGVLSCRKDLTESLPPTDLGNGHQSVPSLSQGQGSKPIPIEGDSIPRPNPALIASIDTEGGRVYGPETWKIWNLEVADPVVPPTPMIDWDVIEPQFNASIKENFILIYIPQLVRSGGEEKHLRIDWLCQVTGMPLNSFLLPSISVLQENNPKPRWVCLSKRILPGSKKKTYTEQQTQVTAHAGFRMLTPLEAIVANFMVMAFTGERLYNYKSNREQNYTRCAGLHTESNLCISVGWSSNDRFNIISNDPDASSSQGVAVVLT